jgi:dihydroorotate dehydrogenase
MLISTGIAIWLAAQWGSRAGERWLWQALAVAGNVAFAAAIGVHVVVGYLNWLHFAPAICGWCLWFLALGLTREWMCRPPEHRDSQRAPG